MLPRRDDLLALVAERRRTLARDVERLVAARRQHVDVAARQLSAAGRERVRRCGDGSSGWSGGSPRPRRPRAWRSGAAATRLRERLERGVPALLRRRGERLARLAARLERAEPGAAGRARGGSRRARRNGLEGALSGYFGAGVACCDRLEATIDGNNPEAILQRGYAIVNDDGAAVARSPDAPPGTRITAKLAHGSVRARVERDGTNGGRQISLF